ncbi:MAG: hypothetical protein U1E56_06580 [Bauldia sp.]
MIAIGGRQEGQDMATANAAATNRRPMQAAKMQALAGLFFGLGGGEAAFAQGGLEVLNRTTRTFTELYFSPAGRDIWGKNQLAASAELKPQGKAPFTVDFKSGRYDVRIVDAADETCLVKSMVVRATDLIPIVENDLVNCRPIAASPSGAGRAREQPRG